MLSANYRSTWPNGSGEGCLNGFLPYMGMAAILNFESCLF